MAWQISGSVDAFLAQNPAEKQRVRQYGQELSELMNLVKAYAQRLQEAMQKRAEQQQANGQGGLDPETAAKIQATQLQAQVKAENARSSHAEKTAQRRISFEQQTQQKAQEHGLKMRQEAMKTRAEVGAQDIKTAAEIRREGAKAVSEAQNNVDKAK